MYEYLIQTVDGLYGLYGYLIQTVDCWYGLYEYLIQTVEGLYGLYEYFIQTEPWENLMLNWNFFRWIPRGATYHKNFQFLIKKFPGLGLYELSHTNWGRFVWFVCDDSTDHTNQPYQMGLCHQKISYSRLVCDFLYKPGPVCMVCIIKTYKPSTVCMVCMNI